MTATEPLVLGIESSCDETGIGIVRGSKLLTNTISSSMEEHVRFGGVIPEIASRAHLEAMLPALEKALAEAGVSLGDIDAIAVTAGPGLAGALMVGVAAAKALAVGDDVAAKPFVRIDHQCTERGIGDALGIGKFTEGERCHRRNLATFVKAQGGRGLFHPCTQLCERAGDFRKV